MALIGKLTLYGQYRAVLPEGCDAGAVAPPEAADWTVDVPSAYLVVVSTQSVGTSVIAAVVAYVDATCEAAVSRRNYAFDADMEGPSFVKQAYEYLKTLDEFKGFADVPDAGQPGGASNLQ